MPVDGLDVEFAFLKSERHRLIEVCKRHWSSIWSFQAPSEQPWFLITQGDSERDGGTGVKHLSSSASCLESLREAWLEDDDKLAEKAERRQQLVDQFAERALARSPADWTSEGGGHIYSRVRTLPEILKSASQEVLDSAADAIANHLRLIWQDVRLQRGRQAIWEHNPVPPSSGSLGPEPTASAASQQPKQDEEPPKGSAEDEPPYPPNAFLTYWGLRAHECAVNRSVCSPNLFEEERHLAQLWLQRNLASQIAIAETMDLADPQQLCWALCGMLRYGDPDELRYPSNIGLVIEALRALFTQQHPNGTWSRGHPLFHYPLSGNAYCYTYETLTELLRIAVEPSGASDLLRRSLRPYAEKLISTAEHAIENPERLDGEAWGWCSHHHPQRPDPESWATAATYSYLENLRRLIGYWTAESARRQLRVRIPRWPERKAALTKLSERGESWKIDGWDARELLAALFLHPVASERASVSALDPDAPLIPDRHARSAILFGPPGTSKTTLVEALAGSIGWDFLEVHASDFLSLGMNDVPRRADEIFDQIMELDRCVILFDEIDELLRDRGDDGSDPFGRFLTTSMLPKLARLWEQRRVIFFVNTNWIDKADPAIKRSQRFDATILVMPTGFETKRSRLMDLLNDDAVRKLTSSAVNHAIKKHDDLGWLAFIRFDQIETLETELRRKCQGKKADFDDLKRVLRELGESLSDADWHTGASNRHLGEGQDSGEVHPFDRYLELKRAHSYDYRSIRLLHVNEVVSESPSGFELVETLSQNGHYLKFSWEIEKPPPRLSCDSWSARPLDGGLLQYRVSRKATTTRDGS